MSIDMSQFHQIFLEESFEGLDIMENGLLGLDIGAADVEAVNTIFRAAHSIKGGSGTFGFKHVSDFTHVVETILDEMRDGRREVSQISVDLLLQSVDCLRDMLVAVRDKSGYDEARATVIGAELERLRGGQAGEGSVQQQQVSISEDGNWRIIFKPHAHLFRTGNDTVRLLRELATLGDLHTKADCGAFPAFEEYQPEDAYINYELTLKGPLSAAEIEEVFAWVEGDCELSIEALGQTADLPDQVTAAASPNPPANIAAQEESDRRAGADRRTGDERRTRGAGESSIRVKIEKVDELINMVGELVITQSMLSQIGEDFDFSRLGRLRDGLAQLERNTRELQESVLKIRMLPIGFSFNRFPRMVRDLSNKMGKQVELRLSGEQTELDKTVMEKIGDPLVHLVRNSLDHGLELPDVRRAAGKPETGVLHLNAYHQNGKIVIEISDDGAGLNKQKILAKAREQGLIGEQEQVADDCIADLIFQPGFSTAEQISDVSGRGVGMDVVRRNIKDLGGTVEVRTVEGQGSKFTIRLPLTLAILDGQLIRVGGQTYIVPLIAIVESLQVDPKQVSSVAGQAELFRLRDEYLPIVRLYELFGIEADSANLTDGLLVVVEAEGRKAGLFVDDLLGQQQAVIKSLETNFQQVPGISGATILGDGTVAMILDIGGLIELSRSKPRLGNARRPEGKAA